MTDEQEDESEEIDDIEVDDVSVGFVTKVRPYTPVTDFHAAAGTDPFYFAGGATKLSEEMGIDVVSNGGIGVTLPANIGSSIGHGYRTNSRPTGSRRGWSSPPPDLGEKEPKYRLKDFFDDEEVTIRKFVRSILKKDKDYNVR